MNQVFSIPELLGAILFELPMDDLLLRIPLVSRYWNDGVKSSLMVQQKLFLKPCFSISNGFPHQNPLLYDNFWSWFRNHEWRVNSRQDVLLNPVQYPYLGPFHELPWSRKEASRSTFLRRDASWRRMLVCQPAILQLDVETAHYPTFGEPIERFGSVCFEEGIRMGVLYDIVYQWMESNINGTTGHDDFEVNYVEETGDTEVLRRLHLRLEKWGIRPEDEPTDIEGSKFLSLGFEKVEIDFKQEEKKTR